MIVAYRGLFTYLPDEYHHDRWKTWLLWMDHTQQEQAQDGQALCWVDGGIHRHLSAQEMLGWRTIDGMPYPEEQVQEI